MTTNEQQQVTYFERYSERRYGCRHCGTKVEQPGDAFCRDCKDENAQDREARKHEQ